jgi:hypothetical protein
MPAFQSTPVKAEPEAEPMTEAARLLEEPAPVHQVKPGRTRLHRRQQSLFLPVPTRRSQVSALLSSLYDSSAGMLI